MESHRGPPLHKTNTCTKSNQHFCRPWPDPTAPIKPLLLFCKTNTATRYDLCKTNTFATRYSLTEASLSSNHHYALKYLLGLQTHSKQVIGECMLNSHKRFCHFVEALVGAEVKLNITLADGQEFPISLSLTKEWVAEVSEISAWLTNLCMHERMLQDRYDRILG